MIVTRAQLSGFTGAVLAVLGLAVAVPSPYGEGLEVDRHTGAPVAQPWRLVADACRLGEAGAVLFRLEALREQLGASPLLDGLCATLRGEFAPLEFDVGATDDVPALGAERLFGPASGTPAGTPPADPVDARAAALLRRLDDAAPPPATDLVAMAEAFAARGRTRARWRWLQRAFARYPETPAAADGLIALHLAHQRLDAAMAVVAAHGADRSEDAAYQRQCAQLGAWLGRPEVEAQALEHLARLDPVAVDRGRLIDLYVRLGSPERGLPHAVALADGAGELAAVEDVARSTLASGFVDDGLDMLRRAAARAPDPRPWLAKLVDLALQDLQVERSEANLARMHAADPGADTAALESLYRRTDQPERLADLLQQRLAVQPDSTALWDEVVALRYALGQRDEARELARQRELALADPERFVATLSPELRATAMAASRQALSMALSGGANSTIVGETLERLRPFFEIPQFRGVAETLLARYPNDPRAKPMRRELVDLNRTPIEVARAAAAVVATYPDDADLVEFWIERADWAELPEMQRASRQRLLELRPGDLANRFALADLLDFHGDRRAASSHWRVLVEAEGVTSPAVPRLIDALFAIGDEVQALEWLQKLADDPRATTAQRLAAADELFYRRGYDRAKVLYGAVLQADPDHPSALLRLGQIHAWTNDPRGARPYLERRLAVTDEDAARVRFYLAEALWATGEPQRAAAMQAASLRDLEKLPDPDFSTRSMMATTLARLGRHAEAAAAYRQLVTASPRDVDLVMDYADVLVNAGDVGRAEAMLRHADALAADNARLLRLRGELASRHRDYAAADRALSRELELYGAQADICSDLGHVRYAQGDWAGALASFERWLSLQADSSAAQRSTAELRDLLATTGVGEVRSLWVGGDRVFEAIAGGVLPLDDRRWLQGRVGVGHYQGRAAAAPGGDTTADAVLTDLAVGLRLGAFDRLAVGASLYPGAPGDAPLGLFSALHLQWHEPYTTLEVRADVHSLWTEPAAAPGLGGRRSGLSAKVHRDLGGRAWCGGGVGLDLLSIDPAAAPQADDERLQVEVTFGLRLLDGDVAVASRFEPRFVPSGPSSPFLATAPEPTRAWACNGWLSYQTSRLLGDAELSARLPLAEHDEHLLAAVRGDHHLTEGFGASLSGWAGANLRQGEVIWGLEGGVSWRPTFGTEVTLVGSHGSQLGRSGDDSVDQLRLQAVLRW